MSDDDRELARLWRVDRTVHEMARDRGYEIADDELAVSFQDFRNKHGGNGSVDRTQMSFYASKPETGEKLFYYFCAERNVTKKSVKSLVQTMEVEGIKRGVLVWSDKMTPAAKKAMLDLSQDYDLEDFAEADLLVNITNHFLVPKHQLMTKEEKQVLLKKYRLKDTQLPRIMLNDPVARYYGVKRGEVMRIERTSETAGRYITYRICM